MNEQSSVATVQKPKKRRSLWWLWLLLLLVVFAGGIILGLKLTTMPMPYDMLNRYFPGVMQSIQVAETPAPEAVLPEPTASAEPEKPAETPAPTVTEAPAATKAPVEKEEAMPAETAAPQLSLDNKFESVGTKYIGVDAALEIALTRAGVKEEDADVSGVFRSKDEDGTTVYEVNFSVDGIPHVYVINAVSGVIESWRITNLSFSDAQTFAANAADSVEAQASAADPMPEPISTDKAKEIAYQDAGVKASSVLRVRINLMQEDAGEVYSIVFRTSSANYSYRIDALSGEILESETT